MRWIGMVRGGASARLAPESLAEESPAIAIVGGARRKARRVMNPRLRYLGARSRAMLPCNAFESDGSSYRKAQRLDSAVMMRARLPAGSDGANALANP